MEGKTLMKRLIGFITFAAVVALLIAGIKLFNWLPMAVRKDTMRKYGSIEEVQKALGIRDLYVPSYFPQSLTWPPSEIMAQGRPFAAVVMEFKRVEEGDIALIISQAASRGFDATRKIKVSQVTEKVDFDLKGRKAVLEVGACEADGTCSRISWDEGPYTIRVVMKSPPFELIKMTQSMLH
jgi:hypothetical protein